MSKIKYNAQYIDKEDIKIIKKVLKSEFLTTGKYFIEFEKRLKIFLKNKYILTCNSGTSALMLAARAINLKLNDIVIMPVMSFIASYSSFSMMRAKIFLSDVDPNTGQMRPEDLENCIKLNNIRNIKAVVTMQHAGFVEHADKFFKLKNKYNFLIIEDACHAFGANYDDKNLNPIGSNKFSDISTFSFHPVKTITTGEGGLITFKDKKKFDIAKLARSHGIVKNKKKYWEYDIFLKGYNFRLSDINCALGISQLKKINKIINKRRFIHNYYKKNLKNVVNFPKYQNDYFSSFHLTLVNLNFKKQIQKDNFIKYLNSKKIFPQFHYPPYFKFKYLKIKNNFPNATSYAIKTVSLPNYFNLNLKDLDRVIFQIKKFFKY